MDEDGITDVLKSERMGHEVPGMRGVYSHVSSAMRADLKAALQERWQTEESRAADRRDQIESDELSQQRSANRDRNS